MHEMAIARRLVTEALERREDDEERVTDVEVVLGGARLSPESMRLHFEAAARDTPADGADLGPRCRSPFRGSLVRGAEMLHACQDALAIVRAYRPPDRPFLDVEP